MVWLQNILIARFTRLKYIFLTGHHTLYMACLIAIMLYVANFEGSLLVIVGSLILGLTMAIFPALAQPFMKKKLQVMIVLHLDILAL